MSVFREYEDFEGAPKDPKEPREHPAEHDDSCCCCCGDSYLKHQNPWDAGHEPVCAELYYGGKT